MTWGGLLLLSLGTGVLGYLWQRFLNAHYVRAATETMWDDMAHEWRFYEALYGTLGCRHVSAIPVESVGEVVAHLCPACSKQLPATWTPRDEMGLHERLQHDQAEIERRHRDLMRDLRRVRRDA